MDNLTSEDTFADFQPAAPPVQRPETAPEPVEVIIPVTTEQPFTAEQFLTAAQTPTKVLTESDVELGDVYAPASQEALDKLKSDINASFEELSNVLLDIQRAFSILLERIDRYNERSSHKI